MNVEDYVIQELTKIDNRQFFEEQENVSIRVKDFNKTCLIGFQDIVTLIEKNIQIIMKQPMLLEITPPVTICGDIHGQFLDLLWVFECGQFPPKSNYLFLGDLVDRGRYSIEVVCLLMAFKIKYPNTFFMLRGNHECNDINQHFGFYQECKTRFNFDLWVYFGKFFDHLPVAAVVGNKIFCVHGGLSPYLKSLNQIRNIPRPIKTPTEGLLCDLVWSDPVDKPSGWTANESRGISYTFGTDVIDKFLKDTNLKLIVRGHEVSKSGYNIIAQQKLITVFSVPNYTGILKNNGAILQVRDKMECKITILNVLEGNFYYLTLQILLSNVHSTLFIYFRKI